MQESATDIPYDLQKLVGIIIPVLLLGFVAIISPFAVLRNNVGPPYYPPPPGWESSVTIYLWAARFSSAFIQDEYGLGGGVTNLHAIIFVIITIIYFVIQIVVTDRKMWAKSGMAIEIILFLIWVSVCQWIYGTLPDWTLIQLPILPIVGISFLLVVNWSQLRH